MDIIFPSFDGSEIENVKKCLDSKWVTQGPMVVEFERLFCERHQLKHSFATTSCTAGLHLSTLALGLGPGDVVLVPAFTWVTSAYCAEYVGAEVRFVDVDPETFNIDVDCFERAICENTKAAVIVHLFGQTAELDPILAIAEKRGVKIIEDAACAIGATYNGKPIGAHGDIGAFSFHPRKIITTGEGGMVTTNNDELADKIVSLRNHGATGIAAGVNPSWPYAMSAFDIMGFNLRLSDILAAVGVAQMSKLDGLLAERKACAEKYDDCLADVFEVKAPTTSDRCSHSYQSYVTKFATGDGVRRNKVMLHLIEKSVQTRPGTHAVHNLGYFKKKYGLCQDDFPNATDCEQTTMALPIYPGMEEKDIEFVVNEIKVGLI